MPTYVLPSQPTRGRGLLCIAELNKWERQHVPYLKSASGRDLYFALAHCSLLRKEPTQTTLKSLLMGLTDRAMRQRLREFEALGLITLAPHDTDARARTVQPTPKLLDVFDAHTTEMRRIFQTRFTFVPKPV